MSGYFLSFLNRVQRNEFKFPFPKRWVWRKARVVNYSEMAWFLASCFTRSTEEGIFQIWAARWRDIQIKSISIGSNSLSISTESHFHIDDLGIQTGMKLVYQGSIVVIPQAKHSRSTRIVAKIYRQPATLHLRVRVDRIKKWLVLFNLLCKLFIGFSTKGLIQYGRGNNIEKRCCLIIATSFVSLPLDSSHNSPSDFSKDFPQNRAGLLHNPAWIYVKLLIQTLAALVWMPLCTQTGPESNHIEFFDAVFFFSPQHRTNKPKRKTTSNYWLQESFLFSPMFLFIFVAHK